MHAPLPVRHAMHPQCVSCREHHRNSGLTVSHDCALLLLGPLDLPLRKKVSWGQPTPVRYAIHTRTHRPAHRWWGRLYLYPQLNSVQNNRAYAHDHTDQPRTAAPQLEYSSTVHM
jgi:hypothetical protein